MLQNLTMLLVIKIIFWGSMALVIYTYLGYPLFIALWARFNSLKNQRGPIKPTISIIISAYNEEKYIGAKISNCFQLDYPKELMQLIVVSDGSTDNTETIVSNAMIKHKNLNLINLLAHKGKAQAINSAVAAAKNQILVFTDARQVLAKNAISSLVANFAHPSVGAASGELLFIDEQEQPQMSGISFYWKYEKWIRQAEASVHSMCGATGAIYAIRKNLFTTLPQDLVLDDVFIPMGAVLAGYRLVFDSNAQAYDRISESNKNEFMRKVRTLYGNYQLLAFEPRLLNPWANPIFLQFFSHKICRLIAPFCLITLFISNLFLLTNLYMYLLLMQLGWYMLALAGFLKDNTKLRKQDIKETA